MRQTFSTISPILAVIATTLALTAPSTSFASKFERPNAEKLGISETFGRWPDGVVPYIYNPTGKPAVFQNNSDFRSLLRDAIAEQVAQLMRDAGIMRQGFSFQAGAGGIALAFVEILARMMREAGITASFVRGGSTKYLVEMLQQGLTRYILDGQTFDLDGVKSIGSDPRHVATSPFTSYNFHGKGNFASLVDAVVLGATEVDVNFNANVVTHSDGRLLHGIGGWQNCLTAGCTVLAVPSFRDRIPVIVDEVTTVTGPGDLIDVVATERGIAINPRRQDLVEALAGSTLPIRPLEEIRAEVERICGGKPQKPRLGDPVAVIKWVDGTLIDTVYQVED